RLGSCGSLIDVPVGSVVVPKSSVAVERNLDFPFLSPGECTEQPYRISKPASHFLYGLILTPYLRFIPLFFFCSSQGRQTSFPDQNENLIAYLQASVKALATLEMETFWLFHLAACWRLLTPSSTRAPPLATGPVQPTTSKPSTANAIPKALAGHDTVIRAAAAHLVFASRTSQDFITPSEVTVLEEWAAKGVLDALVEMSISADHLHAEAGSVWEL
ncbi:hypothetical protein K438DRAFT_1594751, partial [Mycena galopus ATCC 62051]